MAKATLPAVQKVLPLLDVPSFVEKQELTKHERFLKYAGGRTAQALRAIELIGNCSNTQNYEYSQEEVYQIFAQLNETIAETAAKFQPKTKQRFGRNFFEAKESENNG
jgi:hypothetical protein